MSDSEDSYGPSLPPEFAKPTKSDSSSSEDDDMYGPALPPQISTPSTTKPVIGPALPAHLSKRPSYSSDSDPDSDSDSDNDTCYKKRKIIGPSIPHKESVNEVSDSGKGSIGPVLPPHLAHLHHEPSSSSPAASAASRRLDADEAGSDSSDDDYMIGPSIELVASERDKSAVGDVEKRAQKMRDRLEGKEDEDNGPKGRETWMTELPGNLSAQYNLGLTSRQFRKNAAPEQDSSWTETPEEKEKREKEGKKKRHRDKDEFVISEKDVAAARDIEAYNKKHRPDSLYDMHQKERKKKKKKEKKKNKDKSIERRPFDREVDLQVNRLDDAKRRAIIKRSQELGSRFKSGGTGTSFL